MFFAPFRGSLFDPGRVPDIPSATCPPYDVIDETDRRRYLAYSAHNVVRLLLAEPNDPSYQEAAKLLAQWRHDGCLVPDQKPRFYLYQMRHDTGAGGFRTASGVIGALGLHELGSRVLPHEETMPKTKADRLTVLRATRANLDLIIGLTPSKEFPDLLRPTGDPRLFFEVERVQHSLYDIDEPETVAAIADAVASQPVAIADGHHRYTTALQYQEEQEAPGPWDAIMAFIVPTEGSGLMVGPTHRAFPSATFDPARLEEVFEVTPVAPAPPDQPGGIVLVTGPDHGGGSYRLVLRPEHLAQLPRPFREAGPAVAREFLYERLGVTEADAQYVSDLARALELAESQRQGAVSLMAPVSEHAIGLATEAGLRFPQKSTFFVPKPRSGLVIRCFEDG